MTDLAWLFVALTAVWVGIGGYILTISARQRRLEKRLAEIESQRGAR